MKNFYFYKADLISDKPNVMVCFYAGGKFNFESFCNEVVTQFNSSIFTRDIVFITPEFNKEDISSKRLNDGAQSKIKDRINSFQELYFHTCQTKTSLDGQLDSSPKADKEKPRANRRRGFCSLNDHQIIVFD